MVFLQNLDWWDPQAHLFKHKQGNEEGSKPARKAPAWTDQRLYAIAYGQMDEQTRNTYINEAYFDLSKEFRAILFANGSLQYPNWCTFASWASTAVGHDILTIRVPIIGKVLKRAFGYGNRHVFLNIGSAATVFLDAFRDAKTGPQEPTMDERWNAFVNYLGFPIASPPGLAGQKNAQDKNLNTQSIKAFTKLQTLTAVDPSNYFLAAGFYEYYQCIEKISYKEKIVSILEGNRLLLHHEQKLLQPAILAGFTLPFRRVVRLNFWRSYRDWRRIEPGKIFAFLESLAIHIATAQAKITIDGETYRLGITPIFTTSEDSVWISQTKDFLNKKDWTDRKYRTAYVVRLMDMENTHNLQEKLTVNVGQADTDSEKSTSKSSKVKPALGTLQGQKLYKNEFAVQKLSGLRLCQDHVSSDECKSEKPIESEPEKLGQVKSEIVAPHSNLNKDLEQWKKTVRTRLDGLESGRLFTQTNLAEASCFFHEWKWLVFPLLFIRSLPEDYAGADGVTLLGINSALQSDPIRRTGQTAYFLLDLFGKSNGDVRTWGEDDEKSKPLTSIGGLRRMHWLVRKYADSKPWPSPDGCMWLNLEDTLGSALSFCIPVIEAIDEFISASQKNGCGAKSLGVEKKDAYTRAFLALAVLLGVPQDRVVSDGTQGDTKKLLSYSEAKEISDQLRREQRRRNMVGTRLMESMIAGFKDALPRPIARFAKDLFLALGEGKSELPNGVKLTVNEALCVQTHPITAHGVYPGSVAQRRIRKFVVAATGFRSRDTNLSIQIFNLLGRFIQWNVTRNIFGKPYRFPKPGDIDVGRPKEMVLIPTRPKNPPPEPSPGDSELRQKMINHGLKIDGVGGSQDGGYETWELRLLDAWIEKDELIGALPRRNDSS